MLVKLTTDHLKRCRAISETFATDGEFVQLDNLLRDQVKIYQRSISLNFFCQAKIDQHTKNSLLKLQISSLNWHTFCQTLFDFHPICAPKEAPHLVFAKKAALDVDEIIGGNP